MNRLVHYLTYTLLFIFSIGGLKAQMSEKPPVPEAMDDVKFIEGKWENTAKFYNREGEFAFETVFLSKITPGLGGRIYEMESSYQGDEAGLSWFFYHPVDTNYVLVAVDAWGNYDEFLGNWKGDSLVLTSKERTYRNGQKMMWRRTYYDIGDEKHKVLMHYSLDGGETWIFSNRQIEKQIP